jgi:hypothetical protein
MGGCVCEQAGLLAAVVVLILVVVPPCCRHVCAHVCVRTACPLPQLSACGRQLPILDLLLPPPRSTAHGAQQQQGAGASAPGPAAAAATVPSCLPGACAAAFDLPQLMLQLWNTKSVDAVAGTSPSPPSSPLSPSQQHEGGEHDWGQQQHAAPPSVVGTESSSPLECSNPLLPLAQRAPWRDEGWTQPGSAAHLQLVLSVAVMHDKLEHLTDAAQRAAEQAHLAAHGSSRGSVAAKLARRVHGEVTFGLFMHQHEEDAWLGRIVRSWYTARQQLQRAQQQQQQQQQQKQGGAQEQGGQAAAGADGGAASSGGSSSGPLSLLIEGLGDDAELEAAYRSFGGRNRFAAFLADQLQEARAHGPRVFHVNERSMTNADVQRVVDEIVRDSNSDGAPSTSHGGGGERQRPQQGHLRLRQRAGEAGPSRGGGSRGSGSVRDPLLERRLQLLQRQQQQQLSRELKQVHAEREALEQTQLRSLQRQQQQLQQRLEALGPAATALRPGVRRAPGTPPQPSAEFQRIRCALAGSDDDGDGDGAAVGGGGGGVGGEGDRAGDGVCAQRAPPPPPGLAVGARGARAAGSSSTRAAPQGPSGGASAGGPAVRVTPAAGRGARGYGPHAGLVAQPPADTPPPRDARQEAPARSHKRGGAAQGTRPEELD